MTKQTSNNEIEAKIITKALEDPAFMQNLLNKPGTAKAAIEAEMGQKLPADFEIRVVQESPTVTYLVLPMSPQVSRELSEEQLATVAGGGGNCNAGVTAQLPCIGSICVPGGTKNGW